MTALKNGEHTNFVSKNGTTYWVMNLCGKYHVETKYGSKRKVTAEIKENIILA